MPKTSPPRSAGSLPSATAPTTATVRLAGLSSFQYFSFCPCGAPFCFLLSQFLLFPNSPTTRTVLVPQSGLTRSENGTFRWVSWFCPRKPRGSRLGPAMALQCQITVQSSNFLQRIEFQARRRKDCLLQVDLSSFMCQFNSASQFVEQLFGLDVIMF